MIIEKNNLIGIKSELAHLDDCMEKAGFVRWQWEYYRATYDLKIEDKESKEDYYLRINTRALEGKLESPIAVLVIEYVYIGRATFPHGLDYSGSIPDAVLKAAEQKIQELEKLLG